MKYKSTIRFDGSWVLEHRGDDALPTALLERELTTHFGDKCVVVDSTLTALTVTLAEGLTVEEFEKTVRQMLQTQYSLTEGDDVIELENAVYDEEAEKKAEADARAAAEEKPDGDGTDILEDEAYDEDGTVRRPAEQAEQPASAPSIPAVKPLTVGKVLQEINGYIGFEDFKELAQEITRVTPYLVGSHTVDTFTARTFLVSVGDGCGLSTMLASFARLVGTVGLAKMYKSSPVTEKKLKPPKGDNGDIFDEVYRVLDMGDEDARRILCIDISEWMKSVQSVAFREFLARVEKHTREYTVFFRIPYVEREVLETVRVAIEDVLTVRTLSMPPFTQKELQEIAAREIKKYGFTMRAQAWQNFHIRLDEEKRDGKFYGCKTVQKVVRELLYDKQLTCAKRGKPDTTIVAKDTAALCKLPATVTSGYDELAKMVGSEAIRKRIDEIVSQILVAKATPHMEQPCIHMRFVGNPGTGKTTVARILGKILKEKGVLRIGNFYEYSGRDFCGKYIGETAPKTAAICRDAYGSVLFIDEAYSLYRGDGNDRDYGREALDTLIAEMENHRNDFVVIMAGYTDDMEKLLEGNTGLVGRMPYTIEFPNFDREQLYQIFCSMVDGKFETADGLLEDVHAYFRELPDTLLQDKGFSNGRFVRNLYERTWAKAATRSDMSKTRGKLVLTREDFAQAIADKEFAHMCKRKRALGFGD